MRRLLLLVMCASACNGRALSVTDPEPFDGSSTRDAAIALDLSTIDLAEGARPPRFPPPDLSVGPGRPRTPRFELAGTIGPAQLILAGDLNHDGHVDLVTIAPNQTTSGYTWDVNRWLGDGAGGFNAQPGTVQILEPGMIRSARLADLDRDGELDLVTAQEFESLLSICRGSSAAFYPPNGIAVSEAGGVEDVEVADLDGDGVPDLAAVGQDGAVHLFRGQGASPPIARGSVPAGREPVGVRAGDFDRNGKIDLMTVNRYGDDVSFLAGDGHLGFGTAMHFPAGSNPSSMVLADLDGDGALDVAVQNEPWVGSSVVGVTVLYGDGSGGVRTQALVPFASHSSFGNWLGVGDFDGDALPDLVGGNFEHAPSTLVLSSTGAQVLIDRAFPSWSGAVADFDGDSWPDLALTSAANGARIYLNRRSR